MPRPLIIAVDFDGTIVEHAYPQIGRAVPGAVDGMRQLQEMGAKIILWTMRSGDELVAAEGYLAGSGIELFGVNENPEQGSWTSSPNFSGRKT